MAERTLTVKIIGDESDLLRSFRRSTQATQRFSASFGTFLKGAVIFEGVRAGIDAIGAGLRAGADEFSAMVTVAAQTQAVLKSTGGVANVTAGEIDRLATRLSRLSGTDDEAIASAENLILTFKNVRNEIGRGNQIFDRTAEAALDLSKAAGGAFGSLDTTAKQLGKALNDPVRGMTALGRAGVTFTQSQRDTIKSLVESNRLLDAQKLILREVESQVGGSARAFGDTLPGALAKIREGFRNAFGNLVAVVAQPLASALGAFADFIPKIEAGVSRIRSAVGPALTDLIQSFTARLPELQRIATSLLDPLREHVLPILREFGAVAERIFQNVTQVLDNNRKNLTTILNNLGAVLANVWTVARPTIVFLFEKVLPAALAIVIPIVAKLTGITKLLSDAFVLSVRLIVAALDKFLGALSFVADAASHLPGIGDSFKGISDKINASRESLRLFGADLDALDGRTVNVNVKINPADEHGRASGTPGFDDQKKATSKVVNSLKDTTSGIKQVETAAKTATAVTTRAQTAAERQRTAFDRLMETIGLRRDRAAETRGLDDDIAVARATERALRAQIAIEGRTTELLGRLAENDREQRQLLEQRRKGKQFEALGLTGEGDQRVPGVGALRNRLGNLRQQIKGTVLDTEKTRNQLENIAKVLAGKFGKVGRDVRQAILDMFNQISSAFEEGQDGASGRGSGEITRGGIRSTQRLLRGLNLSDEERRTIQQRNLGVSGRRGFSAFGVPTGAPGGFPTGAGAGAGAGNIFVERLYVVSNDPNDMMKKLQKKARRSSGGRRGRHGGANLGMQ